MFNSYHSGHPSQHATNTNATSSTKTKAEKRYMEVTASTDGRVALD